MSSWDDLRVRGGPDFTVRPISTWPGVMPAEHAYSRFRAGMDDTFMRLRFELEKLDARQVVIEMAIGEGDIRRDGLPYAAARAAHPGVVVSFESRHGPLRYATAEFTRWQDNLRAIALGLEALRAVDRYGISRRGEQYAGWKALTAGGPSVRRGRALIAEHGDVRRALMATHPDHGGSPDDFADVQAAREASE